MHSRIYVLHLFLQTVHAVFCQTRALSSRTFSVRLRMQFSVRHELISASPFWLSIYGGRRVFQPPPSLSLTTCIGIKTDLSQLGTCILLGFSREHWQADVDTDDDELARCLAQTHRLQRVNGGHVEGCGWQ
jgi:hypothetical protein